MNLEELYQSFYNKKFIIAGPCVIENEKMVLTLAEEIKKITEELNLTYIFNNCSKKQHISCKIW